jgi:hypothetical protein
MGLSIDGLETALRNVRLTIIGNGCDYQLP